jgi:hypothetical protein
MGGILDRCDRVYSGPVAPSRHRTQQILRLTALAFVAAWLFSQEVQARVPFWIPFLVLALTEAEFLWRGWRELARPGPAESPEQRLERRLPGAADADLGWEPGESAGPRGGRLARRLAYGAGLALAAVLFAVSVRIDTRATWPSLAAAEKARAETRFSREAGVIAGRRVSVRCDAEYQFTGIATDAAGVAFGARALAYLEPDVCRSLYDLAFGGGAGNREHLAFAVTVLAHEAVHLRGVRAEGLTECYALQEGVGLGARLGLPAGESYRLMRAQLERDLADRSIDRFAYRLPPGCTNGGSLDLRPADARFP